MIRKVLVIAGIAGIGKSVLALALAKRLRKKSSFNKPVVWLRCNPSWKKGEFFAELTQKTAEKTFKKSINSPNVHSEGIVRFLEENEVVLFLDDFHVVEEQVRYELVSNALHNFEKARLILITRERVSLNPMDFAEVYEIRLQGIKKRDIFSFIEKSLASHSIQNLSMDCYEQINQKTKGHPFSLKLLVSLISMGGYSIESLLCEASDFDDWLAGKLLDELWDSLSKAEKQVIKFLSMVHIYVSPEEFFSKKEKTKWIALRSLIDKYILEYNAQGKIIIHDLLRDYVRRKISRNEARKISLTIAEIFISKKKQNIPEVLESYFLFCENSEFDKATDVLLSVSELVLFLGERASNVYLKVNEILENSSGYREQELLKFKISLLLRFNDFYSAEQVIPLLKNSGERELHLGFVRFRQEKFKEATDLISRNLRKVTDYNEKASACLRLMCCYDNLGNAKKIKELHNYFETELLEQCSPLKKATFLSVACVLEERLKEDFAQRLVKYDEIEAIYRKYNTTSDLNRIYILRSYCHFMLSQMDQAEKSVEEAIKLSKQCKDYQVEFQGLDLLGRICIEKGNFQRAYRIFSKSLVASRKHNSRVLENVFQLSLAEFHIFAGELDKAEEKYSVLLKFAKDCDSEHEKYRIYQGYTIFLLLTGKTQEAMKYLSDIIKFAQKNDCCLTQAIASFYMAKAMQISGKHSEYIKWWKKHRDLMNHIPNSNVLSIRNEFSWFEKEISKMERKRITTIVREEKNIVAMNSPRYSELYIERDNFELYVDFVNKILLVDGKAISFFKKRVLPLLFLEFCRNPGESLDIDSVFQRIWQREYDPENDYFTLRTNIYRIRDLLDCSNKERFIKASSEDNSYYLRTDPNFCIIYHSCEDKDCTDKENK